MNSFLQSIDPELAAIQEEGQVKLIAFIKNRPLNYSKFIQVTTKFGFSDEQCRELLNLSRNSFNRLKRASVIESQASLRVIELANIWNLGLSAFDNQEEILVKWLNSSNKIMGNKTPIDLLTSGLGFSFVEQELLRIEQSIY